MSTVIWYGAGKNLRDHEREFLEETGMPECICDASEEKQGSEYMFVGGKTRKICSLENVIGRYPDYELWLTLADHNLPSIFKQLTECENVPNNRIRFFGGREWRQGCFNLQNYIYISSDHVKTCAHIPYTNHFRFNKNQVLTKEDVIEKLNTIEAWRRETNDKLRKGEKTSCDGCSALHWGFFTKEPHVEILGVGPNFRGGTKCNCDCFYCNQNQVIRTKSNQELSNYDIHRISAEYYDTLDTIILSQSAVLYKVPDCTGIC